MQKLFSTRTSTAYPFPWIIWIEPIRNRALTLSVIKPKFRFLRKPRLAFVHKEGPIFFDSPQARHELTEQLIDIGMEHLPPNTRYKVALSMLDCGEILRDDWGVQ